MKYFMVKWCILTFKIQIPCPFPSRRSVWITPIIWRKKSGLLSKRYGDKNSLVADWDGTRSAPSALHFIPRHLQSVDLRCTNLCIGQEKLINSFLFAAGDTFELIVLKSQKLNSWIVFWNPLYFRNIRFLVIVGVFRCLLTKYYIGFVFWGSKYTSLTKENLHCRRFWTFLLGNCKIFWFNRAQFSGWQEFSGLIWCLKKFLNLFSETVSVYRSTKPSKIRKNMFSGLSEFSEFGRRKWITDSNCTSQILLLKKKVSFLLH